MAETSARTRADEVNYVMVVADAGQLQACDVASSGTRHILTNVLGGSDEQVEVDIDLLRLDAGDRVPLCSDGLTDRIVDDTIANVLSGTQSSKEACAQLVQLALESGGRDNVTVIVATYTLRDEHALSVSGEKSVASRDRP